MRGLMVLWFVLAASCSWAGMLQYVLAATTQSGPKPFTITFAGTPPSNIVLHANYAGPKTASLALYDSGDGVWHEYSSKTIPVSGGYVAFKGDWRTSDGTYASMFYNALADTQYTCTFSGSFTNYPTHRKAYYYMFAGCTRVTAIFDNPIPVLVGAPGSDMFGSACNGMSGVTTLPEGFMDTSGLTGAPASYMFSNACNGMSGVTTLPEGFMDTSGLTGAPASYMFNYACYGMSGVTTLPEGFMDTSGLTGAPAIYMFRNACNGMSGVTTLPEGFMDTSGLTGAPAIYMFKTACYGMSSVTNAYTFTFSSNITFTAANVGSSYATGPLASAFKGMSKWKGQVMWGTNLLVNQIIPDSRINTFEGDLNMPGYDGIHANWK